jgi:nicotinate-nucleotide adenylyltransferase
MTAAPGAPAGPVGIYGGSFDPVHFGHLRTALEVRRLLDLDSVRFIPARLPPHRPAPQAADRLRLRMLEAAVAGVEGFALDSRELERDGPSYTVDTLAALREEAPDRALILILGMDAFLGLPDWHRAGDLPAYAHFMIAHRPGWEPPTIGVLGEWLSARQTRDPRDLRSGAGRAYVHSVTGLDISSTAIRAEVARGGDPRFLVPDAVREILATSGCYG